MLKVNMRNSIVGNVGYADSYDHPAEEMDWDAWDVQPAPETEQPLSDDEPWVAQAEVRHYIGEIYESNGQELVVRKKNADGTWDVSSQISEGDRVYFEYIKGEHEFAAQLVKEKKNEFLRKRSGVARLKSPEYLAKFWDKKRRYKALRKENQRYYDFNIKWFKGQRENKYTREYFWGTEDAEDAKRAAEKAAKEKAEKAAKEKAEQATVAASFDVAPVIKVDHFASRRRLAADTLIFTDPDKSDNWNWDLILVGFKEVMNLYGFGVGSKKPQIPGFPYAMDTIMQRGRGKKPWNVLVFPTRKDPPYRAL